MAFGYDSKSYSTHNINCYFGECFLLRIRFADLLFSFVFGEAVISTRWNLITVYNCNYVNQVISACLMFKKPKEIVDDLVSVIHSKCGHSC